MHFAEYIRPKDVFAGERKMPYGCPPNSLLHHVHSRLCFLQWYISSGILSDCFSPFLNLYFLLRVFLKKLRMVSTRLIQLVMLSLSWERSLHFIPKFGWETESFLYFTPSFTNSQIYCGPQVYIWLHSHGLFPLLVTQLKEFWFCLKMEFFPFFK